MVRFFDVDWNPNINSAVPVGDVTIETKKVDDVEIIPCWVHLLTYRNTTSKSSR